MCGCWTAAATKPGTGCVAADQLLLQSLALVAWLLARVSNLATRRAGQAQCLQALCNNVAAAAALHLPANRGWPRDIPLACLAPVHVPVGMTG